MTGDQVEVQWRVVWFPPDHPQRSYEGTEARVRARAERELEWNPIIDRREVTTTPWVLVENLMTRQPPT